MLLQKIQNFRNSPNRTVLTFSKSDTFSFSKKSELCANQKDAKICFCGNSGEQENSSNAADAQSASNNENTTENQNNAQIDSQNSENGENEQNNSENSAKSPENGENSGEVQNDSEVTQENTKGSKNASKSLKKASNDNCSCNNTGISGNVSLSCNCNVLLCDLIAGMSALCFVGKMIKSIKRMF